MSSFNTYRTIITLLFAVFFASGSFSQSKKQKQLENKRLSILKEIREINTLLSSNKSESTSLLTKIEDVNLKIKVRQNLIQVTNQQANLLTREIKTNTKSIADLETELSVLKKSYAQMVVKSYKGKSKQSKLMFLFSSDNFLQAYKRYNYMKQYKAYQKKQADSIVSKTEKLQLLNEQLLVQKADKERLIEENKKAQKDLRIEKSKQQSLIADLKKDQVKYKAAIAKKQRESDKLERQIEKMIREAIARSNKKAGKKASTKTFALTPEAKALAASFSANKGKLPWPVKTGRVTKKFGKQPYPGLPGIYTNSSGVEITTTKNSEAKATFKGTVSEIQVIKGGSQGVYIKHGNYITLYYNLKSIYVKKGDQVNTNDPIGKIATNKDGKTVLKFYLFKNNTKLNPASWIYKM